MLKPATGQTSFFGDMIYDRIFQKRSHWLKDLLQVVDFSFVNDLCQNLFESPTGRPAWSPEKLFKVAFLQFCYDISDRRVEEELAFSLIFRYFVGLEADAEPPDHTTICRFRAKLGVERFQGALDADSGIIVASETTPGQVSDHQVFVPLLDGQPQEVTADKAYDSKENRAILSARGVKNGIIARKKRRGRRPACQRIRPAIERKFAQWSTASDWWR